MEDTNICESLHQFDGKEYVKNNSSLQNQCKTYTENPPKDSYERCFGFIHKTRLAYQEVKEQCAKLEKEKAEL